MMIKLTSVIAEETEGVLFIEPYKILSVAENVRDEKSKSFVHLNDGDGLYYAVVQTPEEIIKLINESNKPKVI